MEQTLSMTLPATSGLVVGFVAGSGGGGGTNHLLAENGDTLAAENGDQLTQE